MLDVKKRQGPVQRMVKIVYSYWALPRLGYSYVSSLRKIIILGLGDVMEVLCNETIHSPCKVRHSRVGCHIHDHRLH